MSLNTTGIGDFSNNKYAGAMKELANGLAGWSGFLLLPFLIYQVVSNHSASLFSLKAFFVILAGEIIFVIASHIANMIFSAIIIPLILPFSMKGKMAIAQNIQTTFLAIFSLFLCIVSWFFALYSVNYAYPVSVSQAQESVSPPLVVRCDESLPEFTLGYQSTPDVAQVKNLCSCVWNNLTEREKVIAKAVKENNHHIDTEQGRNNFVSFMSKSIRHCGGMDM